MESLYHQTKRLLLDIQNGLGNIERAPAEDAHTTENEVQHLIDNVIKNCERLDILVNKEPPTRRSSAKLQVDQLKYDCQHFQAAMRTLQQKRYYRMREEQEREALMQRSFQPNSGDTSISMDHALSHHNSLSNTHRELDDLIGSGSSILDSLRDQRSTLKRAHRRVLDVLNVLGLSNTVMRLIERRTTQDKIIFYGGILVTCTIMVLTVVYLL